MTPRRGIDAHANAECVRNGMTRGRGTRLRSRPGADIRLADGSDPEAAAVLVRHSDTQCSIAEASEDPGWIGSPARARSTGGQPTRGDLCHPAARDKHRRTRRHAPARTHAAGRRCPAPRPLASGRSGSLAVVQTQWSSTTPHGERPTATLPMTLRSAVSTIVRSFDGPFAVYRRFPSFDSAMPQGRGPTGTS